MIWKYGRIAENGSLPKCTSEAVVHCIARHQTHAVTVAGSGEMTHCGPLVIFRVVQENLVMIRARASVVATCSVSGVKIIIMFNIVQNSPVIMNRPLSSPTPLTQLLAEGMLAAYCQALPPSLSRVSVDAKKELPNPPDTMYTCTRRVNINISPQYSAVYNGVVRGSIEATRVVVSSSVRSGK